MWSWDKRKAQTLSPSSASRLEYSTLFTQNPSNQSQASAVHIPQHSRLSSSGIPWGYFTTRRPFTTPFTGTPSPAPSDAISRTSPYEWVPDKAKNHTQQTYNRPLSQHQHQYSKQKALTPTSRQSSLPVQHQHSKQQAPIQKRIGRTKRDRSRYSQTETAQQIASTENMSVNPVFEDSGVAVPSSSLRDNVTTRDKWSENKSNGAVRAEFVDNSIYKASGNGYLSDSDSISDVNSNIGEDDVNNFDQEIVKGEGVPLYATVFKNKQGKPAATHVNKPSSPAKSGKKDEPVYSTIGDRKVEVTEMDEQSSPTPVTSVNNQQHMQENSMSSFNLQSAKTKVTGQPKQNSDDTKQGKGVPQKKMSVLDELKLRFSGKMGFLKTTKQPSAETSVPNDSEVTRVEAENNLHTLSFASIFNPADVAPPPPPTAPENHTDHQKVKQSPHMAPFSDTPPPPSFIPPPPPSKAITDAPKEEQEQIPPADLTKETAGQPSQIHPISSKEVLLSNIDEPKDNPEQDDNDTASVPLRRDNAINVDPSTSQTVDTEDHLRNKADTQDDSVDSSDGSSSYTTDSEYSSSQPSSAQAMDGRPKSILKNRNETPLVNQEQLMPLSDSEYEEDNTSSQKGRTQDSVATSDDYGSSSLDRRGVSFTRDTLDNEGTAKKYEKEGITMHKIDKNKELPSNLAVPKSIEENVPKSAAANDQELVQAEPVNVTMPRETLQPPAVSVAAEDVKIEEIQEEKASQEEQVSPIPVVDVVDGTTSVVKPEAPENAPPSYTFTPHVPGMRYNPKPNGITVLNGSLPTNSPPAVVSPPASYHPKPKDPEMYFTLTRTGDNVSVVNISQDEAALDNMSQRLTMDRYSRDTLRSNISVGTLRTMISIGGASDLNDMQATAYPGGDDDTLDHSLPFKVEMFEYKKKQTRTGKYQKKEPHGKQRSAKMLKKTTFADQALGYDAQIKKEKRKQKNRKICRIASFVVVVVIILVTTVLIVYFLLENDQDSEETVTPTPN